MLNVLNNALPDQLDFRESMVLQDLRALQDLLVFQEWGSPVLTVSTANLVHKVCKDCRVLLDSKESLVQPVPTEQLVLLDHQANPVHEELKDQEDLQATSTLMISSLLDLKVMPDPLDLLVLPDHQDLQVHLLAVEVPLKSDQAWEATDHFCTDLVDHPDPLDSLDQKVIWDFQDLWGLMERWALRVSKVFPAEMVHQELEVKLDPED